MKITMRVLKPGRVRGRMRAIGELIDCFSREARVFELIGFAEREPDPPIRETAPVDRPGSWPFPIFEAPLVPDGAGVAQEAETESKPTETPSRSRRRQRRDNGDPTE